MTRVSLVFPKWAHPGTLKPQRDAALLENTVKKREQRNDTTLCPPDLRISTWMSSKPGLLPFFLRMVAVRTSCSVKWTSFKHDPARWRRLVERARRSASVVTRPWSSFREILPPSPIGLHGAHCHRGVVVHHDTGYWFSQRGSTLCKSRTTKATWKRARLLCWGRHHGVRLRQSLMRQSWDHPRLATSRLIPGGGWASLERRRGTRSQLEPGVAR